MPPPPFNTCTPSHKDHIPPSSCRKDTHLPQRQIPAMFSGNVALSFRETPLRRPGPPFTRAKTLQIIEGADTEVFLLTPDRYRWAIIKMLMEETELCDTMGIVRVSEVYIFRMNRPCYISHVLTSCTAEYSLRDTIALDQNSSEMTNRGDSDTCIPVCDTLGISKSKCFFLSFFFQEDERFRGGGGSGERTCTRYYIPPSSIKQA